MLFEKKIEKYLRGVKFFHHEDNIHTKVYQILQSSKPIIANLMILFFKI